MDIAFSSDSKRLASANGTNGILKVFDAGRAVPPFQGGCPRVLAVAFVADHLVTGCQDGSLELFDLAATKSVARVADRGAAVTALAVHGRRVAAGLQDGRVLLWDFDPRRAAKMPP